MSPAKAAEPIVIDVMPFGMLTRVGQRNHVDHAEMGVEIATREAAILTAKRGRQYTQNNSAGGRPVWCGCRMGVLDDGAHWRYLANTLEPSDVRVRRRCGLMPNYFDHLSV